MKKSILCCVFSLFCIQTTCFAVGSPNYLPDGSHPRIWLTSAELVKLNAKQTAADPEWVALEAWCDTNLWTTGYAEGNVNWKGYRGSGYMNYLLNFALAYQVLKDDNPTKAATYAQYVRDILVDGVFLSMSAGDENNGLALVRCGETLDRTINAAENAALGLTYGTYKLGYSNRNIAAIPIAYDWIHESGVLSAQEKTNLSSMMYRWFDWTRGVRSTHNNGVLVGSTRYYEDVNGDCTGTNNCTTNTSGTRGYGYENTIHNFMGGHAFMMTLVPVATYGDHDDAASYLIASKALISDTIIAQLGDDLQFSGGDSTEGWNYGSSFWSTLQGLYGHHTATGEEIFNSFAWPEQLVSSLIHRSQSDMVRVPVYGDWTGTPLGQNRRYQALPIIGIAQRLFPSEDSSKVGQYLLDYAAMTSAGLNPWAEMLWYDGDFPQASPNILPLAHRAVGTGYVTSRSSWTDAPNTVHFSVRLEGKLTNSHEDYDEGTIHLMRGADRLLAHRNMSKPSINANTIVFNGVSHHASNPPMTQTAIDRYEDTAGYMYVSGDVANAWKRQYKVDGAKLFRRSTLHLRPNTIVVYDVAKSNTAVGNLKEWYTQYEADPTVTNNTIVVSSGNSRAFIQTFFPLGGQYTEDAPADRFWRVKYTPAVTQEYDQFLHVIEVTNKTQPAMTKTVRIDAKSGNMRGVYISDPNKSDNNWVAMFTADKSGALVNADISYEVPAAVGYPPFGYTPKHIFVDLVPNTDFTFIAPKSKNVSPQFFSLKSGRYPTEGRVCTSSSQGVVIVEPPVKEQIINK